MEDAAAPTCERCETPAPAGAKFCAECGAALTPRPPVTDVRKIVSALFCDVTGSTALGARLDPEALRHLMEDWFARASAVLARHGGTVEKFVGDAVMAVFGVPVAHEDDALRACRAALELQSGAAGVDRQTAAAHGARFAVRVGVETGEVLVGDWTRGSTFASGTPVNMAARLEQAAAPGECLIGPGCHRLVQDAVVAQARPGLRLAGLDDPVDAWLLRDVLDQAAVTRLLVGRLVGRQRELSLLRQAFERALADRTCQLVTVLGVAGIGKSRLAHELVDHVGDRALVLRGRCLSYGESVTWWPLVEMVRAAAGLTGAEPQHEARERLQSLLPDAPDADEVVARLSAAAGLGGTPGPPEDTAWAVRRLVQELARQRPVVLVVDDLHWAEAGMLAVIDHVVAWLRDVPVLVLVLARPELLEDQPTWAGGRVNSVTAMLEPLGADEVARLTADLLGDRLPATATAKVARLAGGNPLYLEHLAGMLRDEPDAAVAEVPVPPTVAALLTARLDRLPAGERATLAIGSVMGEVLYRGALSALGAGEGLPGHLAALTLKGLVRPADSDHAGEEAFAFTHVLVRETAYAALPKATSADLHERFARWLDATTDGEAYDDIVGAHLEKAFLARAALGRLDDAARAVGVEAANRLLAAARRLVGIDDVTAHGLVRRAIRLREDENPQAWDLRMELVRLCLAHTTDVAGIVAQAESVERAARAAGDQRWATHGRLGAAMARFHAAGDGDTALIEDQARTALEQFRARGDELGMYLAELALALAASMRLQHRQVMVHNANAADHVARAGYARLAQVLRRTTQPGLMSGAITTSEGLARVREELAASWSRPDRAQCLLGVAFFAGLRGLTEESAAAWAEGYALVEQIGGEYPHYLRYGKGRFAMYTMNWPAAVEVLEQTAARFEESGELGVLSTELAYEAHALLHLHQADEAAALVDRARKLAAADDALTTGLAAAAQAWLAGLAGDREELEGRAAEATSALPEDTLGDVMLANLAVGEGLLALGDEIAASHHRRLALDAAERHENSVAAVLVRGLLGDDGHR